MKCFVRLAYFKTCQMITSTQVHTCNLLLLSTANPMYNYMSAKIMMGYTHISFISLDEKSSKNYRILMLVLIAGKKLHYIS